MSQKLHEQIREVLGDADASSRSLAATTESDDADTESARTDLIETARRASELLEDAEPDELLEALGLDTLPDGTEPDSIPAAISRGDPEQVEDLQRLLKLSKLAERDDERALEDATGRLRESVADGAESNGSKADESGSDGDGGAREAVASAAETVSEATGLGDVIESDDGEETAEGDSDADTAGETADLGDKLRSAAESSFEGVGDDLEGLQQRLEEASAGAVGSDDGTTDEPDEGGDVEPADAEADEEEDDGLIGGGLGGDRDRGTATAGVTHYSTMAPPPSERADMKGTARYSTMPDKH
ncbi:hypothetical protein [Natronorubrum halophilum]|uniref:hypothetical protein n=1 Tax=Natronorubrum halophilum TaxID=1702106 RepID=UPI000EF65BA7|nr:hypothetical protein [Natronorubrum halophilum]